MANDGNLKADYLVNVSNQLLGNSTTLTNSTNWRIGDFTGDWWYPYKWTWYDYSPRTIYKYQLICPRCKKTNWAELDTVIVCGCGARLKAVTDKVDYEIPVKG